MKYYIVPPVGPKTAASVSLLMSHADIVLYETRRVYASPHLRRIADWSWGRWLLARAVARRVRRMEATFITVGDVGSDSECRDVADLSDWGNHIAKL